ncbi:hypothetical protein F1188_02170 [Roseospira marina]|uniref:Squalene/phytoene synthase family protein n=1 Tax=Roseospira marina TaxID=140057 RepID=A0A5M6IIY7_9PROT|nr:squalene/phytoene synthase family protein [Roseospira marina]KAA5607588.1 hypothetical protein F1188_02170 [Roseospira marina]MBB5085764.1 phytoene synthase [Roseospira marina]
MSPAADVVRRLDRDRFVLTLMAPPARREALFGLFALAAELAQVAGRVREPLMGVMRLQYWRDVIEAADPIAAARGNPVAEALAVHTLPALAVPALGARPGASGPTLLHELLEAHVNDLTPDPPADGAALRGLAFGTAGATVEAAGLVLGATDAASRAAARHVGTAWGLVALVRATPVVIRQGRLRLPADATRAAGYDPAAIVAGRDTERSAIRAGVRAVLRLADAELAQARAFRAEAARCARPMLRHGTLAEQGLRTLRRADGDPFDARVMRLRPPTGRLLLASLVGR